VEAAHAGDGSQREAWGCTGAALVHSPREELQKGGQGGGLTLLGLVQQLPLPLLLHLPAAALLAAWVTHFLRLERRSH